MKETIKRIIPFLGHLAITFENIKDAWRYIRYAGVPGINRRSKHGELGNIIAGYHVIEKGLTMPETRMGFGKPKIIHLIKQCTTFINKYGTENIQIQQAIAVINEYKIFHEKQKFKLDQDLRAKINTLNVLSNISSPSEQITTTKDLFYQNIDKSFPAFAASRKSVRNYTNEDISVETIKKAVHLARTAPSSCNRQGTRVHLITDSAKINQILMLQGGSRGFGHLANKLIILTGELGVSHGVYERNMAYVDGGMFGMNLINALHYNKIGTCPLNCYYSNHKANKIRQVVGIPKSEVFILMITCGTLPNKFKHALSHRSPVQEIIEIH